MIGQIDSIDELQEEQEESQNIWQMKLDRAYKDKILSSNYYNHMNSFFSMRWNMDYSTMRNNEFYNQLKPRLQFEIDTLCFNDIYTQFSGFFDDLEPGFKREIVHNLTFEQFKIFPPYTETYKDDKRSFPDCQKNLMLNIDEIPQKIFFVVDGEAYASNSTGRYIYYKLPDGSYFGETHVLIGKPMTY